MSGARQSVWRAKLLEQFPDLTPVSDAKPIESESQYWAEQDRWYSSARGEGKHISYWKTKNPYLLKWQCEQYKKPLVRTPSELLSTEKEQKSFRRASSSIPSFSTEE